MSDKTKAGTEPSMDDILASIRKILNEDDVPGAQPTSPAPPAEPLMLTEEMLVAEPPAVLPAGPPERPTPATSEKSAVAPPEGSVGAAPENSVAAPPQGLVAAPPQGLVAAPPPGVHLVPPPEPVAADTIMAPPSPPAPAATAEPAARQEGPMMRQAELVAPAAAAAAAAAMGQLLRAVSQDRAASITRGGPSIEDVVREEMRPLLKEWLDAHLPTIVERAVRAEIERVVSRSV